jgi:hypothetical protein
VYFSPSVIRMIKSRRMRRVRHSVSMGRTGIHIGFLWESQEGKRPLGRPKHGWEDNFKMGRR